jgi:hypothetical protein
MLLITVCRQNHLWRIFLLNSAVRSVFEVKIHAALIECIIFIFAPFHLGEGDIFERGVGNFR